MKRRVLSFVLTLTLCLNLCPVWALADDIEADSGLCPHHTAHTEECGYVSPESEQECTHIHDENCYITETNCVHVHTAECCSDPDAGEPDLCAHICTQDSGCVTRTLSCTHEHDDTCGYAEGTSGSPCTFVCRICPIEELIAALPDSVTESSAEQVQSLIGEIYALYDELTEDEQRQVDLSPCAELLDRMDGMDSAVMSDGTDSKIREYLLTANETSKPYYTVDEPLIINTKGFTLSGTGDKAILVTEKGKLYMIGKAISPNGVGVEVQSGGSLTVTDENTVIKGLTYALYIAEGATVQLSAGTYSSTGRQPAIHVESENFDFSTLLAPGFAYFDSTGNPLSPANMAAAKAFSVKQCTEHARGSYTAVADSPTHTWKCDYCGTTGTEKCSFTFDENGNGTCTQCSNKLTIDVSQSALSNLVYDGSFKPTDVPVTVTLGDATVLEENTDYTVVIDSIKDAGQATVTVTGITFTGKFVKTYTVEPATPRIEWAYTAETVNYDGQPVEAGDLPAVNKYNIQTGDLDSLILKYQYQKDGETGFTDGLPKDAGRYQIKASLEGNPNYNVVETDQLLTLTINQIEPISTAPTATKPTYNRTAQELVTAGDLDPVAIADGLEIQFATTEDGVYSTTIPTGTDAGDYIVWYKVEGLTANYIAPDPNPAQLSGVKILRKAITPVVELSDYTYLYDGGYKQPTVTVKDDDNVTVLLDTEYKVEYVNNQNVSTADNPAKVVVTDKDGGNYDLTKVEIKFEITLRTQETLSITNKPDTFTYGDKFTLQTSGGSGNGLVTWEITSGQAQVGQSSGQVTITGHGDITVKATKSGKDPDTGAVNYNDATAVWTFTAEKKPVTATVTAEDKTFNGNNIATVHAVVESGILPGDEITITGLTGTFSDENAGAGKTVTVVTTGAAITGHNSEHYAVTYSGTTVKATIHKAVAKITKAPVPATLTYDGTAQALIATPAVVDTTGVPVEYALSEDGNYSTDFPKGTDAGSYTVWYRVQETPNYTGEAPKSVDVTIAKKTVSPTVELSGDGLQTDNSATPPSYSYIYDGTEKTPTVTLKDGTDVIPTDEYMVAYSDNVNVGTATVTVTAKADGNYTFENAPVTKTFEITKEPARVITAPEAAGLPLTFNNFAQKLVTEGEAFGGTMVYSTDGENGTYFENIPTETDAAEYTVHYKVKGDANHSDSDVGSVKVTIAPKRVDNPTIELQNADGSALVSYTYDGTEKEPKVVVKDGSTVIADTEYSIVYSDNTDAGHGTVNITDKQGGNYEVTGSKTFVISKANIVFNPDPSAANLTYNGTAQELLNPGTTTGGTVLYALNSATSTYSDAIPTGVNAGTYNVYYKVTGDRNHNDLPVQGPVAVTINRKPLTAVTIELTPDSFKYDGTVHLPAVTVKDGDTVLPGSEYSWVCSVSDPKEGGTYTITVSDKTGGNYDLTGANPNTATFTIGKAAQAELVIEGKPDDTNYGDKFTLTASGGSGTGAVTWNVTSGPATVGTDGTVNINGVGEVTITADKAGDTNYESTQEQLTFTATPKPVTASVAVADKAFDGTTAAKVTSASIPTINSDTVTIDPAGITAVFDDPHAGAGKTVTLDTSKVKVTGDDAAKYAISYPAEVTADITQATTSITKAPEKIDSLTYNGQPQTLVTAGESNVGFIVYSLDGTSFSTDIPVGTDAETYKIYYKVDGTADYTGVAVNDPALTVTIAPKPITPKIELSESSYLYDGTKKEPKITVWDNKIKVDEDQYTFEWANADGTTTTDILIAAGTYKATIKNVNGGNYTFTATAEVTITPAEQAALNITGQPEHVYYGDVITTLNTDGGTGNGTVEWSITSGADCAYIDANTGRLTVKGVGSVTVKAERTVPNYGPVSDNWTFTVEPKMVIAEVTVTGKTYDGTTAIADTAITAQVNAADLVNGDTVALSGLKGAYTDANAGTGKTVMLDSTGATKVYGDGKYNVSYPATAKSSITPKSVTVTVTLSDHDLKTDANGQYYVYDGTEKRPNVTVKDGGTLLTANDYTVDYSDNKNVSTDTVKATVTVTNAEGGNYTFTAETVNFEIRRADAVLTSSPRAKDLTYEKGTKQELVTVGAATGGTVVYSLTDVEADYKAEIPKKEEAGTYTVYYKVKGDDNHADTAPAQVSVTIKSKEITPAITLSGDGLTETNGVYSYTYDGSAKTPDVTVMDGTDTIAAGEYSVSYRDNVNAGTATVTVSDNNGGNYVVSGTASFEITKKVPEFTPPEGKTGLYYTGELQALVNAGVCNEGTVLYSLNGGSYTPTVPTAYAVGEYEISYMVKGDANHSDTAAVTLSSKVKIDKNTVNNPTITLSSDTFKYNGSQQKPTVTVYDGSSRLIPEREYTVKIEGTNGNAGMVDVDTYTVTVTTPDTSNYVISGNNTRTFVIVPANQETISITGTKSEVRYGDTIQLGISGGTGDGTVTWKVTDKDGNEVSNTISSTGLLTVNYVGGPYTVTVKRSVGGNYTEVSASWEFTAAKKPVTAVVTAADRNYAENDTSATVTAAVPDGELAFPGDVITITGLTGTFDDPNVGTGKTVTLTGGTVGGAAADKYDVMIPAATTASILGVAATVDTEPTANTLTYDAAQSQELVTAGTATGGTMVYSLDGTNYTPNIPKGKDAGTYKVYYRARGDQNHTDSAVGTKDVTIARQTVTPQIELSPPSGQYDGTVQRPAVTVRDGANNVIPTSEYKVTYVTDGGANWKDQGTYTVKVENIDGGNYIVTGKDETFTISTSAQAPLEIVNKPGVVRYGDTFTLSTSGGSGSEKVTWSSSDENIAHVDTNGLVTIKGTGPATITAKKPGGTNYEAVEAAYPLNALKKPVTAIVTADDKVYDGNTNAAIHVTWKDGDLIAGDIIDTSALRGEFADAGVGTGKTVTITGTPASDATSQKYDITIPDSATASITKAAATAPTVTAVTDLVYTGSALTLVTGGDVNTLYCESAGGVYSADVPQKTNAGTYTVWYKERGDANHSDSEPQPVQVTISPKTLALTDANVTVELSGNDLQTDTTVTPNVYYYNYDGTDKTPTVTVKDGAALVPAGEYTVSYSDNRNVSTDDRKATVTVTDNADGNYIVSGSVSFEIRAGGAKLTAAPRAADLSYIGPTARQELVTMGTAEGGHLEYKLSTEADTAFSTDIPKAINAGTYTVDYRVVGDANHTDGPTGSVTVVVKPKTVVSPTITVDGGHFSYTGGAIEPTVTVEDDGNTISAGEYTLSYRDNVNAGTATVILSDNNGGNYTVSGTATFEIGKAAATVGTAPTGKAGLHYNGSAQELITAGSSDNGTMVYSLTRNGEYSAAIPTGKAVGEYEIWYKVLGDDNHSDSEPVSLTDKVKIDKNTVANPTINVEPASVKYTGEKQEPAVTVKDDAGLVIDGSEYTVTYADTANGNNSDLIAVGTYTVTVTGKGTNYSFGKTAEFKITPADQTALTITGTREHVYYGDNVPLGTTGGIDGANVTWGVNDGAPATIDANGLLKITGVGSVTVTAASSKTGYAEQTATWNLYAEKKPVTALVTAAAKTYDGTEAAAVTATLQGSNFVGTDSFTVTLNGCTFEDANAGTNKKVNVVSTSPSFTVTAGGANCYDNYAITYPGMATAAIFKADIADDDVSAPTAATGLTYTGLPLTLVSGGSATGGTLEFSTDGNSYSATLTATDAGEYEIWYRVKGDANHNDTDGTKLADKVNVAPQNVGTPTIEFTPSGASYDGKEHKPAVMVKDSGNRVIPAEEYTVVYGEGDWTKAGNYEVTVTDNAGGNYTFTETKKTFTILVAGQSPLSITNKPGKVRYGDSFTLSAVGGSAGTVIWDSSAPEVASVADNGTVTVHKAGPVTITAKKLADGNYGEVSDTWSFSAEKKPVTAIVTADDKEYDGNQSATLHVTWNGLVGSDTLTVNGLTGTFDNANAGTGKPVTLNHGSVTLTGTNADNYDAAYPDTATASITPKAAALSGSTPTELTYDGSAQELVTGITATDGEVAYSTDGDYYTLLVPKGTDAGTYAVWYKARAGSGNYKDSDPVRVNVTVKPKTVTLTDANITLSPDTFEYDGTAKKPEVTVKDGSTVISPSEYTVSYGNNTNVGTATVTVTDNPGGNYTVSGSKNFNITAGEASLKEAPKVNNLIYNGFEQELVTAGTAVNGQVVYAESRDGSYSAEIPMKADAGTYQVWYKVQGVNGAADTAPKQLIVTIRPKDVTPTVKLGGKTSYSVAYDGSEQEPAVTVYVESKEYSDLYYTVEYTDNINPGTAEVTVTSTGGNYQFLAFKTFTITKGKAAFMNGGEPIAKTGLAYTGEPLELVIEGIAADPNSTVVYSLDRTNYSPEIPTAINRGTYTVYAKVQGDEFYEDSSLFACRVTIGVNTVNNPVVTLPTSNFPYTGSEVKPTVTVTDGEGNVISADEYTVTYSSNVEIGEATISIRSKTGGNYSFTASATFNIVDASQTPLTITGKKEGDVYYGDILSLVATGGGDGAVTWSAAGPVDMLGAGQYRVTGSGSVTITAAKGSASDTWSFYAQPKPVTAVVTAANKDYDGNTTAALTVTISSGLVGSDTIDTTTENGVKAEGHFSDGSVGTNKPVLVTKLTVPAEVSKKYEISYNNTTTASISPAAAAVTKTPVPAGSLTYNGSGQPLLTDGGTAVGGNLMYSLDGRNYSYTIPTGTDAGTYTLWYKAEAGDKNHEDSAAVKLGDVTISRNTDPVTAMCTPGTVQYDGTEKTPTVVVRDSAQRIIPESEYTVTITSTPLIAVGEYTVTVTDRANSGNYEFGGTVTAKFEIVSASQPPLSIITDIPTDVHYGDTFRLSAMGGIGSGTIQWSIKESGVATVNANGVVTVTGTGGFTVEAYRKGADGYSDSNTDSVPFVAKPKPVTPTVTAADKPYDGKTDAELTASWKSGDLVSGDTITLPANLTGVFASPDAGTNKRVTITPPAGLSGTVGNYVITWPERTTASIYKIDAELATAPAGADLTYNGEAQNLVTAGSTVNNIGTVVYSTSQNGTYSETIPTGTGAGKYTVWHKVADSVNYTGIAAAAIEVEIKKATPTISTKPTASTGTAGQQLSDITFSSGGAASVDGRFAWKDGSIKPAVGKTQQYVTFTPNDTANYNTVEFQIEVTIQAPSGTDSVSDSGGTETVSAPMRTTVRNGTANTVLSADAGSSLVREAAANNSQSVVIKPEITDSVTKAQVSIPSETVSRLGSETTAALTVSAPIADVTIPNAALDTLSSSGGTVDVATEQVGDAVTLTLSADGEKVESVPGGVTLTVPAENATPGTVAVLVKEDGSREVIQKSVTKDGAVSVPLDGSATVELVDNSKSFDDVAPENWAADAVDFVSSRELFNGTAEATFSPDSEMSRGMLATVLYNLEGKPDQDASVTFDDVSSEAWYSDSVSWAAENGIVSGYGDGQYGPDDSITREQFAVMLWKYAGSPEAGSEALDFEDADQASDYARKALSWAVANGIMNGYDGRLSPRDTTTRAQAAQMLKNFMENT